MMDAMPLCEEDMTPFLNTLPRVPGVSGQTQDMSLRMVVQDMRANGGGVNPLGLTPPFACSCVSCVTR